MGSTKQEGREYIAFLQIPKVLFVNQQFKGMSVGAKLLYLRMEECFGCLMVNCKRLRLSVIMRS